MFDQPKPQELVRESRVKELAGEIANASMFGLNLLTLELMKFGIAATFSQYIPELHDENPPAEVTPAQSSNRGVTGTGDGNDD